MTTLAGPGLPSLHGSPPSGDLKPPYRFAIWWFLVPLLLLLLLDRLDLPRRLTELLGP